MEDSVIPDVMNDVFYPKKDTLKFFLLISQFEVCQEGGYLEDVEGSLTGDMEDMDIPDVMSDVFRGEGPSRNIQACK